MDGRCDSRSLSTLGLYVTQSFTVHVSVLQMQLRDISDSLMSSTYQLAPIGLR